MFCPGPSGPDVLSHLSVPVPHCSAIEMFCPRHSVPDVLSQKGHIVPPVLADKTKKARAVILPLLKEAERESFLVPYCLRQQTSSGM